MTSPIQHKIDRLQCALERYDSATELPDCLLDFLVDARHWCDHHDEDFREINRKASRFYREEVASE